MSPPDSLAYLLSAAAVRDRAALTLEHGRTGQLLHWDVDDNALPAVAARVVAVSRAHYPDLSRIPYHSRWRHFSVGGVDRYAAILSQQSSSDPRERLRSAFDLVISSVLLDAGAGPGWSFRETPTGIYARSEGLAVASLHLFQTGQLSSDAAAPLRADSEGLRGITEARLALAFQVGEGNPLIGTAGRAALLRRLGDVVAADPKHFPPTGKMARIGNLADHLVEQSVDSCLPATTILKAVLNALGPIWPGRLQLAGVNLGDVWNHPHLGLVPLHKLSQWLTYSLLEPLELFGLRITDTDGLTGLAEYRNGGLFVDAQALIPRTADLLTKVHTVDSPVIVEWRSLTVALLDEVAAAVRTILGTDANALPLAKVLEGGTWAAGRQIARERRSDGGPPLRIQSDGTVF